MTPTGHRRSGSTNRPTVPRGAPFAVPVIPPFAVQRPRLLTLLDVAAQQPFTVVVAPPGYGKTVLLSQWVRAQRRAARWLTLGPEHNDPLTLLDDLRAALGTDAPGVTASAGPQRRPVHANGSSRIVGALIEELEHLPPTTLVLDDLHQLSNPAVVDLVAELLDRAPRALHVIAATRVDPPLPFYRLHSHEVLFQLRQEDLAFAPDETAQLVRRVAQIELSDCQIAALIGRTDGWAAGLQLAALALPSHPDVEEFVSSFAGDDRAVADYLTERVLTSLPPHLRDFLLATCLLDRMTGTLCDFVTGRTDSASMLDELERRSLFITALDSDRSWFRYHLLFLTYLRSHVADAGPGLRRQTLQRAATWHRLHGDLDTAVRYLVNAGCWREVLELVSTAGPAMVQRGDASVVAEWIALVPESARPRRAAVALEEAAALIAGGKLLEARAALDRAAAHPDASPAERAAGHLLRAWSALRLGDLTSAVDESERALSGASALSDASSERAGSSGGIPPVLGLVTGPHELVSAAQFVRGAALVHLGNFSDARDALGASPEVHAVWQLLALGSLALLEAWSDRLDPAEQHANRALRLAEQLDMLGEPATVQASVALAAVARSRGQFHAARKVLDEATSAVLPEGDRLAAADLVDAHALLALAEGDAAACLATLASQPGLGPPGRPTPVTWRRPAVEADLFLSIGDVDRAARLLAEAPDDAPGVLGTRVRLELARGDLPAARDLVARWPANRSEQPLTRLLATAVIEHLDGDEEPASRHLDQVVQHAAVEGNVGLFRWHEARNYVRSRYRATPTAFLRSVVEQPVVSTRPTAVKELVEQLTEREYRVLQLLPTRLTNAEMASALGISLNTVKTHLKHVYRKLGVEHRSEAIAAAERLGLL